MATKLFPKRDTKSTLQASVCLLVRKEKVLLGLKKRGFGQGKWNGMGGKVKDGESIIKAAVRETKEEVGVEMIDYKKAALIHFYFPDDPDKISWNQDVHVFICNKWKGGTGGIRGNAA